MGDVPNIEGLPDPRKASEISGSDSVDPEKFKKLLKVEDTDESQKRNQRQKPKKQEEEEELDAAPEENPVTPQTSFSSYLEEPKKSDTIFSKEGGAKQPIATTTSSSDKSPSTPGSPFTVFSKETKSSLNLEGASKAPASITEPQKTTKIESKEPLVKIETLAPGTPSSKATAASSLPSEKSELFPTETLKQTIEQKKESLAPEEVDTSFITAPQGEKPLAFTPSSATEKKALLPPSKIEEPSLDQENLSKEDKKKEKKAARDTASLTTADTTQPLPDSPPLLSAATPAYATLSSEVFELFEKLVGLLIIEEYKGISTTTIVLSMPGSLFDKCEIKLEHYATAPHAFNIQLLGNPKAVTLFTANLQGLNTAFLQGNYPFQVNLKSPSLSAAHRPLIRRKEKAGGNPDEDPP